MRGPKEAQYWSDITADMMSDEEKQSDVYIRHPPLYRSSTLTKFIEKLDSRSEAKNGNNSHPRQKRQLGTSIDAPVPLKAKNWMLKSEFRKTHTSEEAHEQEREGVGEHTSVDESDSDDGCGVKETLDNGIDTMSSEESN